ncbi:hypothetical protein G7Z17_g3327 [Cylindrodendrum hubeiense]|uniref:Zn(2)-C6 fungal-type domain-containing protein n=1 Tax=Cylindrodendrum hubeiense TaxID=595255 RepID=A0A9P5LJH4_9HYPO|nr:hypothetical protein G7Z17_g3327 [Cylindrodendrum hubeiense]
MAGNTGLDEHQPSSLLRSQGGKACTNCVRIKCKCIYRVGGSACERCYRLKKICEPSGSDRRRGPKRHAAARSDRLEEKLDDIVSILRSQRTPLGTDQGKTNHHPGSDGAGFEDDISLHPTVVSPDTAFNGVYIDEPSLLEAEECLKRFREDMVPYCPYIHIPSHETSVQLRQTYPFLWLNIMSVASKSLRTRNSLNKQARGIIIHKIAAGSERSFDMLLGLTTFVNWEERTDEERRAVLGAFVITSATSHCFKAADGLRWSSHLEEYLTYFTQHNTASHDKVLIAQVRMFLIFNQVRYSSLGRSNAEILPPYIDVLQSQLDDIAATSNATNSTLPESFQDTAWNSAAAREVVDPISTLNKISHVFEHINAMSRSQSAVNENNEMVSLGMSKVRGLKLAWQTEYASKDTAVDMLQEAAAVNDSQAHLLNLPEDLLSFYMLPGLFDDVSWP